MPMIFLRENGMANKTLLDGVNEVLKKVGVIVTDLTGLTQTARQRDINLAVQSWNEVQDDLYTTTDEPFTDEQAEGTITLTTGTRTYSLAADLLQLRWPLIDKTNAQVIVRHPGGYNAILEGDLEQDDTGLAISAAIRPTDGMLYLERIPTAADNGNVYTYQYDKDLGISTAAAEVPFNDAAFRAVVVAVAQVWKRERNNVFDGAAYTKAMGRASRLITQSHASDTWSPR